MLLFCITWQVPHRRVQSELFRDDQGTNLGREVMSPRFQSVNEQENILDLTTKHKKPTRFETCCTNASLMESGVGQKNSVSTHVIEITI